MFAYFLRRQNEGGKAKLLKVPHGAVQVRLWRNKWVRIWYLVKKFCDKTGMQIDFCWFRNDNWIDCLLLSSYFWENAQSVKNLPAVQDTQVLSLGWEDPLEKEMATHSSTLAWKISWTEQPGGLQSMGSQRVGHDWVTNTD